MKLQIRWIAAAAVAAALLCWAAPSWRSLVHAQARKPTARVMMTRLFTGPDGQTHAEEIEAAFGPTDAFAMLQVKAAEMHRYAPGYVNDWHPAPRRQYVITLSGHGEIEVAGGKKISMGPGHIDLVEDTTGKGHITKVLGTDDRVTLQLPLADQSGK